MKIRALTGAKSNIELDKRQHVPAIVEDDCPKCGTVVTRDLSNDTGSTGMYLSYPMVNVPKKLAFVCDKCEHEWSQHVVVRMTLEIA